MGCRVFLLYSYLMYRSGATTLKKVILNIHDLNLAFSYLNYETLSYSVLII